METKKFLDGEGLKTLWNEITSLQSDYNETDETSPNYIKNKPFTIDVIPEEIIEEFTFTTSDTIDESTGLPTMQYVQLFNDLTIGQKMNLQFTYPELAAATGLPQYDDNGEVIFKTVKFENIEVGNFADAMGSQFLDSPAIMMGPGSLIATLPESIQKVAIPNDDIVFVYSNAILANGTKTPLLITALMDWSTGGYSTYVNNCIINTFIPEDIEFNADSITKQTLQANWDQSNKEEVDYIKNKPFGEEILITPINEIYIKDFPLFVDDDSSIRYADFSLGLEVDKSYTIKVYDKSNSLITIVTAVGIDAQSMVSELPAGIKLLYTSDIDEVFAADGLDFDTNGNPIYNPNKTILFDIEDDIYKSEIVGLPVNGRTYDRIKIKKIQSKYLEIDVDQEFSETSENPQSGIAVNEAILQFKNKLPSSVITRIQTLETLGDKHIRVQYNSSDTNTYPYSNSYNIYTEGIGLNSDLKTNTRGTLVAAINEVKNTTDSINTSLSRHYDLITDNQDNIKKNTIAINDVESHKQSLCWNFPTIETDSFNEYKNSNIITNNLEKENIDIFIDSPYQYTIPLDYKAIDPYCLCVIDPQNKVIRQITEKGIEKNYYLPETAQEYLNSHTIKFVNGWSYKHTTTTTGFLGNKTYNSSYSGICINILDYQGKNLLQLKKPVDSNSFGASVTVLETTINGSYYPSGKITSGYSYTVSSSSDSELGQSWTQTVRANGFTGNGFLPTDKENPGLLQWIGPDKKLYSFGQDDWTNAQVYDNFKRALNAEGVEVLGNSSNTGIDNNQHSVYCQDPNSLSYIYCITSAGEVLRRSITTGSIAKRWIITTDSDLFTENLQYLRTYFINNKIYAIRDKNLYVIDISTSGTASAKLISDNFGRNDTHASLFITNDNIIKFSSPYETGFKEINVATLRKINSFSTPIQSDYNQNDDTQLDFIQNRPVYEDIIDVDYTRLPAFENSLIKFNRKSPSGYYAFTQFPYTVELVENQEYSIDVTYYYFNDTTLEVETFQDIKVTAQKGENVKSTTLNGELNITAALNSRKIRLINEEYNIEIYIGCSITGTNLIGNNVRGVVYFVGDLGDTNLGAVEYVIKGNIAKDGRTQQDVVIKQLSKHLIETDLQFNKYSTTPQSGIAVQQAVDQGKPVVSETLGDDHIQIIENENGSPQIYTEGIGLNENLQTDSKNTLVDAINEVVDTIENYIPKSIETLNEQVVKYAENQLIAIEDISPIEHNINIKVTSKNLIDISKIEATPESTALNYISEVGEDYVVINSTEDYIGNGCVTTDMKLKDLCSQLEIGKSYIINAETSASQQQIHLGGSSDVYWNFGKNLTITEDILNLRVDLYGLSTYSEQGTGECRISNIQVYEADKEVTEYTPYVDVSSLNLNVQGKNLLDINLAMLNYDISHGSAVGTEFNSSTAIRANNGYIVFDKMNIKGGQTYTISLNNEDLWLDRIFQLDENSLITKHHSMYASNIDQAVTTITTANNTTSLIIRLHKKDGSITTIADLQKAQLQVELHDTYTNYEPYFNENYTPDTYGNISLSYRPYTMYIDINSDKVNMFVSYNKKLDGIYYDIQKLQSKNNQLQQKVETLEQIIQTNEERITLLENTVSNLVSVLSNQ